MFYRKIISDLQEWAKQPKHKPLVLRGARQVGKTTAVRIFGGQFKTFIDLNLELLADRKLFEQDLPVDQLLQAIYFAKNITKPALDSTLIFIDEIQCSLAAVAMLRYFYEVFPELHVIAAGSLLESLMDVHISFPVGRVEYAHLYPLSFSEFLTAMGEKSSVELLAQKEIQSFAHDKLLQLFHLYTMLGGMPEIIDSYRTYQDWVRLAPIYEGLLTGYQDDAEKYARDNQQAKIIRHVIAHAPLQASSRIKFQHFGNSNYGSREVGEVMKLLEKTLLLKLIYPTTDLAPPFEPDYKKSPRLQFLDTGLVNYFAGLQKEYFTLRDLNHLYQGKIVEHIVGQQLLSSLAIPLHRLLFWVREKAQSSAEVDFVIPRGVRLIPIEVKAGKTGTLRSLHSFIDNSDQPFAIRLYAGKMSIESAKTISGKSFQLINLPYYLSGQIENYI